MSQFNIKGNAVQVITEFMRIDSCYFIGIV